jgi:Uncharacterized protein conserved in bacteria (DUF2188)
MTSFELITTDGVVESPEQWRELMVETLERLDPTCEDWTQVGSAVTMLLVDAVLSGDTSVLEATSDPLRDRLALLTGEERSVDEARGWLRSSLETVRWALQRLPSPEEVSVGEGQDRRFLEYLAANNRSRSAELRKGIPSDHAQLSRVGRKLLASGLVLQRRVGREAVWELTPRGQRLMRHLGRHDGSDGGGAAEARPPRASRRARASVAGGGTRRSASKSTHGNRAQAGRGGARMFRGDAVGSRAETATSETRYIVEGERGWQIKKTRDGRTVETRLTKDEAVARAKQILQNVGGGEVRPIDRNGEARKPIRVTGARA